MAGQTKNIYMDELIISYFAVGQLQEKAVCNTNLLRGAQ